MSATVIFFAMFIIMLALLLTGQRLIIIIGAVGTIFALALWGEGAKEMSFYATYSFMKWYVIIAAPLFIFMGTMLARSGVADDLYQAIYIWMGRVRGGLGMGTIAICALMAAMIGESASATLASSIIALPSMLKRKYDKVMAVGTIQAGGALGILIPPSLIFIIYGMLARVSVGHLWLAGAIPGIMLATMYIIYIGVRCYLQPHMGPALPSEIKVTWGNRFHVLLGGIAPVIIIFAVLGLLFMGVTTLMECAAVGALLSIIAAAIHHRLTWKLIRDTLQETLRFTSLFLWIVAAALLFSSVFDGLGAVHVVEPLLARLGGRYTIIIAMMVSWMIMGAIMDDTAMLIIVAPIYVPIVMHLGFDLVWFGVLYVINCQMAYITPPFGYNLFIMRAVVPPDIKLTDIYKSAIPFVIIQFIALMVVIFFPQVALWLPNMVFGRAIVTGY